MVTNNDAQSHWCWSFPTKSSRSYSYVCDNAFDIIVFFFSKYQFVQFCNVWNVIFVSRLILCSFFPFPGKFNERPKIKANQMWEKQQFLPRICEQKKESHSIPNYIYRSCVWVCWKMIRRAEYERKVIWTWRYNIWN